MKLEAVIEFPEQVADLLGQSTTTVDVDVDYVTNDEGEIRNWIEQELKEKFGMTFYAEDFEVTNMADLLEDIAYEEYQDVVDKSLDF